VFAGLEPASPVWASSNEVTLTYGILYDCRTKQWAISIFSTRFPGAGFEPAITPFRAFNRCNAYLRHLSDSHLKNIGMYLGTKLQLTGNISGCYTLAGFEPAPPEGFRPRSNARLRHLFNTNPEANIVSGWGNRLRICTSSALAYRPCPLIWREVTRIYGTPEYFQCFSKILPKILKFQIPNPSQLQNNFFYHFHSICAIFQRVERVKHFVAPTSYKEHIICLHAYGRCA
jgi:hypothetical protein